MKPHPPLDEWPETKRKLVDASASLIRARGFNATTLDEICAAAGVTKGGFFHYFKSKNAIAKAALARFGDEREEVYRNAPFRKLADPLDRVFGRLDFVTESYGGTARLTKGCLIGVLAQELSFTNPELRGACHDEFARIARDFEADLAEAKAVHAPEAAFDPKGLAMLYVSVVQGSLMLAKASESNRVLIENIERFRGYVGTLFGQSGRSGEKPGANAIAESRN
jgi:TetR/AcrR family transcriptional repressor of nem operon